MLPTMEAGDLAIVSGPSKPAFKVFLSHRYASWSVNTYFFSLLESTAEIQFDVDEGSTAMNVTRLERMLRDCDAFIGIYPYDGAADTPTPDQLRNASRYFRLELDLAMRSRKPMIVFCDERYGSLLRCPSPALTVMFDEQEVTGAGGFPSADRHRAAFSEFCELVSRSHTYETAHRLRHRSKVGLVLPTQPDGDDYSPDDLAVIGAQLEQHGFDEIEALTWPPALTRQLQNMIANVDWLIVDVGVGGAAAAIVAYLHACFVPTARLAHLKDPEGAPSELEQALFGDYEVGYRQDILRWRDVDELRDGLHKRLVGLRARVRRISTLAEAEEYFQGSAKRKESVFLSYSGRDADVAANVSGALKRRFQHVFDYRDGESLKGGGEWLPSIFEQLSTSAVGVPLLSHAYLESGHCLHEAQGMVDLRDSGKMFVVPVKLAPETLQPPSFLSSIQYMRLNDFSDAERLVEAVIAALDDAAGHGRLPPETRPGMLSS
jgi:hypothetical protein